MARLTFALYCLVLAAISSASHPPRKTLTPSDVDRIMQDAMSVFPNNSFEVHPFKVDWYNKLVAPKYKLHYENDAVGLIFFSIPYVFNNSIIPFFCKFMDIIVVDSYKKFIKYYMKKVQYQLEHDYHMKIPDEDILYSFEMIAKHVAVLVQTAGHVAGGAYYYQRKDVVPDPWPKNETIYGVSIHPLYGGYFSLDAVIILRDFQVPKLEPKNPPDVVKTWMERKKLLTMFNKDWKDAKWREIIHVKRKYTHEYMKYILLYGKDREMYVKSLIHEHCKRLS